MLVVIKFRIRSVLRFLSHAETLKVLQRACVRSGIQMQYSQGFNPRPRISLPLPRSVGLEVDQDLACIRLTSCRLAQRHPADRAVQSGRQVEVSGPTFDTDRLKETLEGHLPEGWQLLEVRLTEKKVSFQPCRATYLLKLGQNVPQEYSKQDLKTRIKQLLASQTLCLERQRHNKDNLHRVDVRPFLESIELKNRDIVVNCRVSSGGTIRPEEILTLLGLGQEKLAAPVRRIKVLWHNSPGG